MDKEISKTACGDVLAFNDGKLSKEDFISNYKKNVSKAGSGSEYAGTVEHLIFTTLDVAFLKEDYNISTKEAIDLKSKQDNIAKNVMGALFEIAYTRKPNNQLTPDGLPMSDEKKVNIGIPAEAALNTLSRTPDYTTQKDILNNMYFHPQKIGKNKFDIKETIRTDAKTCHKNNKNISIQIAKDSRAK